MWFGKEKKLPCFTGYALDNFSM